jgi:hypothetical protein
MALESKYPKVFETIWNLYPKWPQGRSVKQLAFNKYQTLRKTLQLTDVDIDCSLGSNPCDQLRIQQAVPEERVACLACHIRFGLDNRASWQRGHKYGPQAMQVWINQRGWWHDFETTRQARKKTDRIGSGPSMPWENEGITETEWQAKNDWIGRKQLNMPQKYATLEEAMAAARAQGERDVQRH